MPQKNHEEKNYLKLFDFLALLNAVEDVDYVVAHFYNAGVVGGENE